MPTLPLWMLNLGRAGQGLLRGTGWGRKARGVEEVTRAAQPEQILRYTPIRSLKEPVVNPYNPDLVRRWGRTSRDQFRGVPGVTSGGTRAAPTLTYAAREAQTRTLPPGWVRQHPYKTGAIGGAGLATLPLFMGGGDDEQAAQLAFAESGLQQWQPPVGIGSYAEYEAEEGKKTSRIMKKALQQYMVLSFTAGPEAAKNYLEMVDKIMEQGRGTRQKTREAKIYDAVFGDKNNLPKSSEDVFNRITLAGGSPEYAAEISGYVGEVKKADVAAVGKQSTRERVLERIRQIYAADQEMGIRAMVEAWMTGTLDEKPIGDYETLLQKAAEVLSGVPASEASGGGGITSIRMAS